MAELKPCPFCGGEEIVMYSFDISSECVLRCLTCGAVIETVVPWGEMDKEQHDEECKRVLTEAWNRRVNDDTGKSD